MNMTQYFSKPYSSYQYIKVEVDLSICTANFNVKETPSIDTLSFAKTVNVNTFYIMIN